ncbi:MAG: DNA polymerase III subunit delta' [Anaerolineae bacterium]|nr:DNA polymerase III subunit delta' [Anaerolineae bacterium]
MSEWSILGHDWAVQYLRQSLAHGRVRHAYLIVGTPNIGKHLLAHTFASALNCTAPDIAMRPCGTCRSCKLMTSGNHPDMIYGELDPNSGILKIDAVRAVISKLAMKPYEARYRVAIFDEFDRTQARTQDAMLKTLEEPPAHAVIILIASGLDSILPTILSRSQIVHLRPVSIETLYHILKHHYGADDNTAKNLAHFSGGRIGWAISALQNPDVLEQRAKALNLFEEILMGNRIERFDFAEALSKDKDKQALFPLLELWLTYWRDILHMIEGEIGSICNIDRPDTLLYFSANGVTTEDALRGIKATQTTLAQLSANINLRLRLEVMFLDYPYVD